MNQDGGNVAKRTCHGENSSANAEHRKRSRHTDDLNGTGLEGNESIRTRAQTLPGSRIHVKDHITSGWHKRQTRNRKGFESSTGAGNTPSFDRRRGGRSESDMSFDLGGSVVSGSRRVNDFTRGGVILSNAPGAKSQRRLFTRDALVVMQSTETTLGWDGNGASLRETDTGVLLGPFGGGFVGAALVLSLRGGGDQSEGCG